MTDQNYEKYWKLTLEYSDINSDKFIGTLKIIIDFINKTIDVPYSEEKYKELTDLLYSAYPKADLASVRKSINQFVKLGFIGFHLESIHPDTLAFLEAKTIRKRKSIFSKIVYTASSFNKSVTNDFQEHQINFLIKTLEEVGKLHKKDVMSLMTVDITHFPKGFLNKEELEEAKAQAEAINFIERKYNQVDYLWNILNKLDDLIIKDEFLYFEEDAQALFGNEIGSSLRKRDIYLYRLYKNQLIEESEEAFGKMRCMFEGIPYPSLVASHIKPFIKSSEDEAYDPNNGFLLSRNIDMLFDLGYVSFNDDGSVMLSSDLDEILIKYLQSHKLDKRFLNEKRLKFLDYHRSSVFRDSL